MARTITAATDPFKEIGEHNGGGPVWTLTGLNPAPEEEWRRLREFLQLGGADLAAMVETVEPLFRRGYELVVGNYDHLLKNHETAEILGWEREVDEAHLAERRRFFTVWLARTLGLDLSADFARYLFRAGQIHAGHGPRQIEVPEVFVTGAISLVNATFARFLAEEMPDSPVVPAALAGWNKMLSLHLQMMLSGYRVARELDSGDFGLKVSLFGRMRTVTGRPALTVRLAQGSPVETALRKFFNYFPQARAEAFDVDWLGGERTDPTGTPWLTVEKTFRLKPGWRVLVNGRELAYGAGLETRMAAGDELSIFPPGR